MNEAFTLFYEVSFAELQRIFLTVTIPYFLQLLLSYRRIVTGICTDSKEIIKKSLKIFKKT